MYQPLTPQQFQAAQKAGFSTDQIIANEKIRQQQSNQSQIQTPTKSPGIGQQFLNNIGNDAKNLGSSLLNTVTHPIESAKQNIKVGYGLMDKIPGPVTTGINAAFPQFKQQSDQALHKVGSDYAQKYGVNDALQGHFTQAAHQIGDTAFDHPLNTALDASVVLDGAGAGLKSAGLADAAKFASKTADVVNPINAAVKGGGAAFGKVGGVVEAPFKSSFNSEAAQQASEAGVKLPASALSNSKLVQGAESILSKGLFGQKIYDTINNAKTQLNDLANTTADKIKPGAVLDNSSLGTLIKTGFNDYKTNFRTTQNQVYTQFLKKVGDTQAETSTTLETLKELSNPSTTSLLNSREQTIIGTLTDKITGIPGAGEQGFSSEMLQKMGVTPDITFSNLKATRTEIGNMLTRDPGNHILNQLYGSLSEDMDATVHKADPSLGGELKSINESYQSGITRIQNRIGKVIDLSNPENLVQKFIKPNNATNLGHLKELIGPDHFQLLANTFVSDILKNATVDGVFKIDKFSKQLTKYDGSTLHALLGSDGVSNMDQIMSEFERIKNLQKSMDSGTKIREGSQTAFSLKNIRVGGEMVVALGDLLRGDWRAAALLIGENTAEYGATKFFTTDIGRKYLTEGFDTLKPLGQKIQGAAKTIGTGVNVNRITK